MKYLVTRDHEIQGVFCPAGSIVEIRLEHIAAKLSSDHEGLLVPILDGAEPEPSVRIVEQSHDRMERKGKKR
jgi:hypothetical protein